MVANGLAIAVGVLHVVFGLAESVGWSQMSRRFGYNREATETTRTLALNQGAYNGGVAMLLFWGVASANDAMVTALLIFVVTMGAIGAWSVRWTLFVAQGVPALLALAARFVG